MWERTYATSNNTKTCAWASAFIFAALESVLQCHPRFPSELSHDQWCYGKSFAIVHLACSCHLRSRLRQALADSADHTDHIFEDVQALTCIWDCSLTKLRPDEHMHEGLVCMTTCTVKGEPGTKAVICGEQIHCEVVYMQKHVNWGLICVFWLQGYFLQTFMQRQAGQIKRFSKLLTCKNSSWLADCNMFRS